VMRPKATDGFVILHLFALDRNGVFLTSSTALLFRDTEASLQFAVSTTAGFLRAAAMNSRPVLDADLGQIRSSVGEVEAPANYAKGRHGGECQPSYFRYLRR
jgi:hypothetical protein